jgi:hypothetical protein
MPLQNPENPALDFSSLSLIRLKFRMEESIEVSVRVRTPQPFSGCKSVLLVGRFTRSVLYAKLKAAP